MKDGENKLIKKKIMPNIWFLNETCIKEIDWLGGGGEGWYFIDCAFKISGFFFFF